MEAYRSWRKDNTRVVMQERYPLGAQRSRKSRTHLSWLQEQTEVKSNDEAHLVGVYLAKHLDEYGEDDLTELRDWVVETMAQGKVVWYRLRTIIATVKKELGVTPQKLERLKLDKHVWNEWNSAVSQKLDLYHTSPLDIDVGVVVKAVFKALDGECPLMRLCALQLCVGARKNEMIKSNFTLMWTDRTMVHQHYLSKKRLAPGEQSPSVVKPVIFISAFDFVFYLDRTRAELEVLWQRSKHAQPGVRMADVEDVATKGFFTVKLTQCVPRMFPKLAEDAAKVNRPFGTHMLRAMYAVLAFEINKPKCTLQKYVQSNLGHIEGDLSTANCYTSLKVVNCKVEPLSAGLKPSDFDMDRTRKFNTVDDQAVYIKVYSDTLQDRELAYKRLFNAVKILHDNRVNVTASRLVRFGVSKQYVEEFAGEFVDGSAWVLNVHEWCSYIEGLDKFCWIPELTNPPRALPSLAGDARAPSSAAQMPPPPPRPTPQPEAAPSDLRIPEPPDPLAFLKHQIAEHQRQKSAQPARVPLVWNRGL